jgi:hypothetical protein
VSEVLVSADAFYVPKAGSSQSEYEDAVWPGRHETFTSTVRVAVADGATETSYSGIWAKQLVRAFRNGLLEDRTFNGTLKVLQEAWYSRATRKPLPWYAEEKVRSGAYAALVGLTLHDHAQGDDREHRWTALAVGDSCLVQSREETIVSCFPLTDSVSFASRPALIPSRGRFDHLDQQLHRAQGTWETDDSFYLMTDALACWFIREYEQGRAPWRILRDAGFSGEARDFNGWMTTLRRTKTIKNDDVTLLRVRVEQV